MLAKVSLWLILAGVRDKLSIKQRLEGREINVDLIPR